MPQDPSLSYEKGVGVMSKQSGSLPLSASSGTYGATTTVVGDSDNGAMNVEYLALVTGSMGSETVTLSAVATYADGTTSAEVTIAATTSTTTAAAARDIGYVLKKDGTYIVSLALKAKSSINTSGATASFEYAGTV